MPRAFFLGNFLREEATTRVPGISSGRLEQGVKRVQLESDRGPVFVRPDAVVGVHASGVDGMTVVSTNYGAHYVVKGDPVTINQKLESPTH